MNAREKVLAGVVGGLAGLAIAGFAVRAVVIKPLQELDKRTATLRDKLEKARGERRAFFAAEEQIKQFAHRTFSDNIDQASARSAEMLTRQLHRAGLRESDFSRLPTGQRKLRGAQEIGWSVQGDGPLQQIVNLVFLLNAEPHLNRVESLVVTAAERPGIVRVRFRYLTLVIDPAPIDVKPAVLAEKLTLDSPERRLLDFIAQRDILRPYIKRPPAPPAAAGSGPGTRSSAPSVAPGPESLKIVSLSEWQGRPEVHVRDLVHQRTTVHRPGDPLAGGVIEMIDYRPLPDPVRPGIHSFSRIIVKVGADYWAVERGSTLDQRYKLLPEQLPEALRQLAAGSRAAPPQP